MACRTYQETQRYLMEYHPGYEKITEAVLEKGYSIACGLSSATEEVYEKRLQISMPKSKRRNQASTRAALKETQKAKFIRTVPGDIHRPQHQEFGDKMQLLMTTSEWTDQIKEPELMRMLIEDEDDPKLQRVIMDDPLSELA